MLVSRCCKKDVFAMVEYYTCSACHFPCDIVLVNHNQKEYENDTTNDSRNESKAKGVSDYS
jgi:hypothetical protein